MAGRHRRACRKQRGRKLKIAPPQKQTAAMEPVIALPGAPGPGCGCWHAPDHNADEHEQAPPRELRRVAERRIRGARGLYLQQTKQCNSSQ